MTDPAFDPDLHSGRRLGPDEKLLWRGRPAWRSLLLNAFHVRVLAGYFIVTAALGVWFSAQGRLPWLDDIGPLAAGLTIVALAAGLAFIVARSTQYLITDRRVILRYGLALPRSLSLPYAQIARLAVAVRKGGRGDIALTLKPSTRVPYLKLWPHARPWRIARPEPMLRDIPEGGAVASMLAALLAGKAQAPAEPAQTLAPTTTAADGRKQE